MLSFWKIDRDIFPSKAGFTIRHKAGFTIRGGADVDSTMASYAQMSKLTR